MSAQPVQSLIHRVNNLLTVVHTQVALARTLDTLEGATAALAQIERAAVETEAIVREARRELDDGSSSAET